MSASSFTLPLPCIYEIAEGTRWANKSNKDETFILKTEDPRIWMTSFLDGSMTELWQALEDDFQERMSHIRHEEMWLLRFENNHAYYRYPFSSEQGALRLNTIIPNDNRTGFIHDTGIEDALNQFEEDLDYETWVNSDPSQNIEKHNLDCILAAGLCGFKAPFEDLGIEYVGQLTEESATSVKHEGYHYARAIQNFDAEKEGEINIEVGDKVMVFDDSDDHWWHGCVPLDVSQKIGYFPANHVESILNTRHCQIGNTYLKYRCKIKATVSTHHPLESKGYAKATSNFGDIYIPEKFRNFIPPIGENVTITAALQDVGDSTRKGNSFRWTAIYIH